MLTKDLDLVILSADIYYYAKKKCTLVIRVSWENRKKLPHVCVFAHSQMCVHVHEHDGRLAGVKLAPDNVNQKSVQSGKNGTCG